jgi:hypothetical protein
MEEDRNKEIPERKNSRVRVARNILIVTILMIVVGLLAYYFSPRKKSFQFFPMQTQNTQLSCETKAGITLFPRQNYDNKNMETIDAEISGKGSKLAIGIGDTTLKLLTDTSVGIGTIEPAEMTIVRKTIDSVEAVYFGEGLIDAGVDSFILNRKSGFAVWTKSKPSFFGNNAPDTQAYYLQCY